MIKIDLPAKGILSLAILLLLLVSTEAEAQITFQGRMYMDYEYELANEDAEVVGENGFTYRRMYFTANYKKSDTFSGRVRFETHDGSTTAQGRPAPFVKDLYLKWKGALGDGHDLYFGIAPPPVFLVAESYWGYRSLEKTALDKYKVVSSRDFGVKALGDITSDGRVKYGVMIANNESVKGENDKQKRAYGQLEFHPNKNMSFTVEADYGPTVEDTRTNLHAFGGFKNDNFHGGVELFRYSINPDQGSQNTDLNGISLFGSIEIADKTEAILRADLTQAERGSESLATKYYLAGLSYQIEKGVTFIPNIVVTSIEGLDSAVTGRITLEARF